MSLKKLELTSEMISLEAMSPTQLLQALPKRLPAFFADVKSFVSGLVGSDEPIAGLVNNKTLEKSLKVVNYVSLAQVTVFTPPGMDKQYLDFLNALEQSQDIVDKLQAETLEPTLRWLAILLTNPETMASVRGTATDVVFHDLKKAKEKVAKCFSHVATETSQKYGDVFRRNGDWVEAVALVNHINERLAKIDRTKLVETVNEITGAMDKLLIRMQQAPETYKMSGVTMQSMAKLSLNLGYELEFFSAHCYMVQSTTQAIEDSRAKLEEVLNPKS